jgi:arsenical pump membrane protein
MIAGATTDAAIWGVAGLATAGVIVRPFRWPEAVWALSGAAALLAFGLISWDTAWRGIGQGLDVYLFLADMMLLSTLAQQEGLFDWAASLAAAHAKGSPTRLFTLVFMVGIVVTVFLSNDATAVVLTPAVYAATRAAQVSRPLPYLLVCAFIANAASFVLPISNPANLVVFSGGEMPPLLDWLALFALPSLVAIATTYAMLWLTQRRELAAERIAREVAKPHLSFSARLAALGIAAAALVLIAASAWGVPLGLPTLITGMLTAAGVLLIERKSPTGVVRAISWDVLLLVAGLFVLVEALNQTGLASALAAALRQGIETAPNWTAAAAGTLIALGANLTNNLPAGLIAAGVVQAADAPRSVAGAILIGVDLGPNLSITGSLATILWLTALRRAGLHIGAWRFLAIGSLVMIPALVLSLATLLLVA